MRNDGLTKTFLATAAIAVNRIVKSGSADNKCTQASAVSDYIIGVSADVAADAALDPVDVIMEGIANVVYGGAVTRGQRLTTDANGKAVVAVDRPYQKTIAGGSAGALTVTGIMTTDTLISVHRLDLDATAANIDLDDLTSEFTITAANTIDNTAGTATTGDKLLVTYQRKDSVVGTAMVSGVSGDIGSVLLHR